MIQEFAGSTAVVTGAASGIGKAIVAKAAKLGMQVVAGDIDEAGLGKLASAFETPDHLTTMVVDVADSEQVRAFANLAFQRYGAVHLLFNNAGIASTGSVWLLDPKAWRRQMDVNFMGAIHGVHHFLPRMLAAGTHGAIVNTGSLGAVGVAPNMGAYCASKHAMLAMSESLLYELQSINAPISVSLLCPANVQTAIMMVDHSTPEVNLHQDMQTHATLANGMAAGITPDAVADDLFTKVAQGVFWIFPQPEQLGPAEQRHSIMMKGGTPTIQPLTDYFAVKAADI